MHSLLQPHKKRPTQPTLLLRPADIPTWDQFPESCREEARKLIAQMFIARAMAGAAVPANKEADHE